MHEALPPIHALYLNGLNRGTLNNSEIKAIELANNDGFAIEHIPIDWLADDFETLLDQVTESTKDKLKKYGTLVLIGASAGGSLAVNAYARLHDKEILVVTLCSRLHEPGLAWWDLRNLKRMAHIGTPRESKSFMDSINYCQNTTIPGLSDQEKQRITTVKQWADEVVPRPTMNVNGLSEYMIPGFGHQYGITSGIKHLKKILDLGK